MTRRVKSARHESYVHSRKILGAELHADRNVTPMVCVICCLGFVGTCRGQSEMLIIQGYWTFKRV